MPNTVVEKEVQYLCSDTIICRVMYVIIKVEILLFAVKFSRLDLKVSVTDKRAVFN